MSKRLSEPMDEGRNFAQVGRRSRGTRTSLCIAGLGLAVALLAGCGGQGTSGTTASTGSSSTATSQVTQTSSVAAAEGSFQRAVDQAPAVRHRRPGAAHNRRVGGDAAEEVAIVPKLPRQLGSALNPCP